MTTGGLTDGGTGAGTGVGFTGTGGGLGTGRGLKPFGGHLDFASYGTENKSEENMKGISDLPVNDDRYLIPFPPKKNVYTQTILKT